MLSAEEKLNQYISISVKLKKFDANEKKLHHAALKMVSAAALVASIFYLIYMVNNDTITLNYIQGGSKPVLKTGPNFKTYYTSSQFETI